MHNLTEFALFQIKFYLVETGISEGIAGRKESQQQYRAAASLISRMMMEINDDNTRRWNEAKG